MTEAVTQSLCPVCLMRIDAAYIREGGTIFLRKKCPIHGTFCVPAWKASSSGPDFVEWRRGTRIPAYPKQPATLLRQGCPYDCGLCPEHTQHTCTGLIEVTQRCSLHCPVCYANAGEKNLTDPPLSILAGQLDALAAFSGTCNVQLSGGEPTERNDLPDIIRMAKARRFGLVQINTNGHRLATQADYALTLKNAGLDSVYLQFDAIDDAAYRLLRGQNCLMWKEKALHACQDAGLGVVLVCTVVHGINDSMLGDLLIYAVRQGNHVRGIHFQPVSSFGRFPWDMEAAPRLTLPELMQALELQSNGLVRSAHFHAPSCEHPLCSFSAVYGRKGQGLSATPIGGSCCSGGSVSAVVDNAEGSRISKVFTAAHWKSPHKEGDGDDDFSRFLATAGADNRFTISSMAFQDAYSLDIERLRGCCIHVVTADKRLVPFCAYNLSSQDGTTLYR